MRLEVRRLEQRLALLHKEDADVIRWFYFEEMAWPAIAQKTSLTVRSMQRRKKRALDAFARYYSVAVNLQPKDNSLRMDTRFISYLHEERYIQCRDCLKEPLKTPGIEAMLYIITGCNELWNAGVETFIHFETQEVIPQKSAAGSFSPQGTQLLRIAHCYANGLVIHRLAPLIDSYFPSLEYVHLELAIEAMRLALFPTL